MLVGDAVDVPGGGCGGGGSLAPPTPAYAPGGSGICCAWPARSTIERLSERIPCWITRRLPSGDQIGANAPSETRVATSVPSGRTITIPLPLLSWRSTARKSWAGDQWAAVSELPIDVTF